MLNTFPSLLTYSFFAPLVLRIVLGFIFLVHGYPKIVKADVRSGTAQFFASVGFRPGMFWLWVVALVEVIGGIFLIIGLWTQIVALFLAAQMLVAMIVQRKKGLVGGIEFELVLFAMAVSLVLTGAGAWAFDLPL